MSPPRRSFGNSASVPHWVWIPALCFTSFLLIFLVLTFFVSPSLTDDQRNVVRWLFSLLAGFASLFLGGTCLLKLGVPKSNKMKVSLSATGGIAVFLFTYMQRPYWYQTPLPDSAVTIAAVKMTNTQEPVTAGSDQLSVTPKENGLGLSLLDVTLRNRGPVDAVVHKGELIVRTAKATTLGGYPYALPVTYQYNVLVSPSPGTFAFDLSQVVPKEGADRFQIIFAVAHELQSNSPSEDTFLSPYVGEDGTDITKLETEAVLRLHVDEDRVLETKPFKFVIFGSIFGIRAKQIAGLTLAQKEQLLLSTQDVDVVESLVRNVSTIGGEEALHVLTNLRAKDLTYLGRPDAKRHSEGNVAVGADEISSPEQRVSDLRATLDRAIQRLETFR